MNIQQAKRLLSHHYKTRFKEGLLLREALAATDMDPQNELIRDLFFKLGNTTVDIMEAFLFHEMLQAFLDYGVFTSDENLRNFEVIDELLAPILKKIQEGGELSSPSDNLEPEEIGRPNQEFAPFGKLVCERVLKEFGSNLAIKQFFEASLKDYMPSPALNKESVSPALLYVHKKQLGKQLEKQLEKQQEEKLEKKLQKQLQKELDRPVKKFMSTFRDESIKDGLFSGRQVLRVAQCRLYANEITLAQAMRELASYSKTLQRIIENPPCDLNWDISYYREWKWEAELYYTLLQSMATHQFHRLNHSIERHEIIYYISEFQEKMTSKKIPLVSFTGEVKLDLKSREEWELEQMIDRLEDLIREFRSNVESYTDEKEKDIVAEYQTLIVLASKILSDLQSCIEDSVSTTELTM